MKYTKDNIGFKRDIDGIARVNEKLFPNTGEAALRHSIAKWESIVDFLEKGGQPPVTGGASCALCHFHFHRQCDGCPVMKKTGKEQCYGTPYEKYDHAVDDYNVGFRSSAIDKTLKYARKEVEFLKSLLPKKKAVR